MNIVERRLHERTLELAASAIDFDLTSAETIEVEAHLAACQHCVRDASAMRADVAAIRAPAGLVPSRRVDDAISREIARGGARPQRLLLLAAATLLLVALLGTAAVGASLLRRSQTLPTTALPTPTAPVALVDPSPATPPVVVGKSWGTIAIPDSDVGTGPIGLMEAVTVTESGLIAVGGPVCAPRNDPATCRASVWTAAPSKGWTRAPDQPGLEVGLGPASSGLPGKGMSDVASGPAGLVAIGYAYDQRRTGIWRSPDGQTWERVQVAFGSSPADEFDSRIVAIAASPQGYVIVGYVIDIVGPAVVRARAASWASPDGVTWTRAADTADMDVGPCVDTGEEPACGGMRAVVATGSGFVAVGQGLTSADPAAASRPAAWTSTDGSSWTRSDTGLDFDGYLSGVTVGGPGLVTVGTMCLPDCVGSAAGGVAAASVDGATWRVTPVSGAAVLSDVATAGGPVFALGVPNPDASPPGELQLWRSGDGDTWMRVTNLPSIPDATGYRAVDMAATEDRLVIVGWAEVTGADAIRNFAYVSPTAPSR